MKKRGTVRFQVSGLSMERLMNEACRHEIRLKNVKRGKYREITACLTPEEYGSFCGIAQEKGFHVGKAEPVGALRIWERDKKRWGLWAGLCIAAALLIFALSMIWEVRIENAGPYLGEIKAYLQELGVRPGVRRDQIPLSQLQDNLEWRFPRIKWIRAEYAGTTLKIRVEEGTPPPLIADQGGAGDVIAGEDGLLLRLNTFAGTPAAKAGQWVRAGQVLIRGEERGQNGELVPVKARGEAIARVWISRRVQMDVREYKTVPTGENAIVREISAPFFHWMRGEKPDYQTFDLERTVTPVIGVWFPVTLIRDIFMEADTLVTQRDLDAVRREAGESAWLQLKQALIADEIVDKWMNFSIIEEDTMVATATAEVRRDIARYRKE
ncbi:MAG: sporulation protein YqfD [Clostridia bacterium]|nr:sporulation protein YqfD [Clostridia bacterium]